MEQIHIGFMKDLKNVEFGELFDIISSTLTTEKINNQLLTTIHKRILPHNKALLRMNNKKLRHPLTPVIQEQVQSRTKYLSCLRLKVEASMLSPDAEEVDAAELLQLWLSPYKKGLYPPSIHLQSRMVSDLMTDRDESAEIQNAIGLLRLDTLIETIVEITAKMRENVLLRLNDRDEYVVNGQEIRKAAYADLKLFVQLMNNTYQLSEDEAEKEQLREISSQMNGQLKDFRTKLRVRNTKRKNKKDVVVAVKELINDSSEEKNQEKGIEDLSMVRDNQLIIHDSVELSEAVVACATPIIVRKKSSTLPVGKHLLPI